MQIAPAHIQGAQLTDWAIQQTAAHYGLTPAELSSFARQIRPGAFYHIAGSVAKRLVETDYY